MKKGVELSLQTIVVAALSVIVLIVVILVFGGQVRKAIWGYNDVSNASIQESQGKRCASIFIPDRKCVQTGCPDGYAEVDGEWKDCQNGLCCERE